MPPTATPIIMTSARSREPHRPKKGPVSHTENENGSQVMPEHIQTIARRPALPEKRHTTQEQVYTKKAPHRSGKPIINWFQRKLAGTVKTRRTLDRTAAVNGQQKVPTASKSQVGNLANAASRSNGRSFSSPWPQSAPIPSQRQGVSNNKRTVPSTGSQRRTVSLNGGDVSYVFSHRDDEENVDATTHRSSLARDSMWSPASALEADEDASLRPLPPSAPPSPSLSHSSSSYLSHSQTFRSIAASTKPTTVLSIDLPPAGVGHIAQVPVTPISQNASRPHARSSSTGTSGGVIGSGASITFSALPPPESSSPPTSSMTPVNVGSAGPGSLVVSMNGLQAPLHTAHHPRNNPRPSSPPLDNASVLTLASSAYAIPGARVTMGSMGSATPSGLVGGGDSISHFGVSMLGDAEGENTSQFIIADDERLDVDGERDGDASLRALRPRSSRRCSWESEVSGWSARILGTGAGMSTGSKSLWTSNSLKTGPLSLDDGDDDKAGASLEIAEVRADNMKPETEGRDTVPIPDEGDETSQLEPSLSRTRDAGASVEDVPPTLGRSTGLAILDASLTDHEPRK